MTATVLEPATWWDVSRRGDLGAAPLYATPRDPAYRSEGARVAVVAQALGTPLMPWQRYTAAVAGELNPDGSYRYPVVVVSVPRQSGKTTLMRAVGVDRCISRDGCGVFYTAQTGKDARERWRDLVDAIKAGPLAPLVQVRTAAGSERVQFPNGSAFRCFAPVATSLHGYTPPLVMLDEAFAHDEQAGDDLMGAIGPAQVTLPHRQLWIVSTAGTAQSVFLRKWVDLGRARAPGVALLEWGAADGLDIYDPATWETFHPAMHTGLVTREAIQAQAEALSRAEFERAYGNRWTRTASHTIPADQWDRLAVGQAGRPGVQLRPDKGVVYAFDVMHDRSASALVASWWDGEDLHAKVVQSGPGLWWLEDTLRTLYAAGWREFACADDGPAREVADLVERRDDDGHRLQVRRLSTREVVDSWGFLMQHLAHRTLTHDGTDALAVGASNVVTRPTADGARPSRRHSAGDVSPLLALEFAVYALEHREDRGGLEYGFGGV